MIRNPEFAATLKASDLRNATQAVCRVVNDRFTIPILSHALLEFNGDRLRIVGTNLDHTVAVSVEANGHGSVTVPASRLASFASFLSGSAEVSLNMDGGILVCASGRSRHRLPTLDARDFPTSVSEPLAGDLKWRLATSEIKEAFDACSGSIETGKILRAYFHGIRMEFGPQGGRFVAADGHQLCMIRSAMLRADEPCGFIVPSEAVPTILALISDGEMVNVHLSSRCEAVEFGSGDTTFRTKLMEAEPPAYDRIVPQEFRIRCHVAPAELLACIQRGSNTQNALRSETNSTPRVEIGLSDINISNIDPASAEQTEDFCACENTTGQTVVFGMNARYMIWALKTLSGAKRIEICANDAATPVMVRDADDKDAQSIRLLAPRALDKARIGSAPQQMAAE